jgi:hypothetical protein
VVPASIGAVVMAGLHAALPEETWLASLALSAAGGTLAYGLALCTIGLTASERAWALRLAGNVMGRAAKA